MIETREQYDEYNISGDMDYSSNDWAVLWANDIRPTIETLREAARVASKMLADHTDFDPMERQYSVHVDVSAIEDIERALDALPDWITEEEKK